MRRRRGLKMREKPRLERQPMCDRLAMEFQDGWIVNLGVGMPTLCSNYVDPHKSLVFHSENGAIGYGPLAPPEKADRHLVNAGGQQVTALPGLAIVDRKSTRLNSSHVRISYAVFCLKKKKRGAVTHRRTASRE